MAAVIERPERPGLAAQQGGEQAEPLPPTHIDHKPGIG